MSGLTIAELSERLKISERTVIRQIQTFFDKYKNLYSKDILIPLPLAELVFDRQFSTNSDEETEADFEYVEGFTTAEYVEFQKRINEYPVLREYIKNLQEQIEFLRFNSIQQTETIKNLSEGIKQRNFIEVKEKKLDQ